MLIDLIPEWQLDAAQEAEITALIAASFDTDFGGRSFYQTRHHLRLLYRQDGRLLGHMAMQFRAVRLGDRLITVAGLAEVATDPLARGKGVASALLQRAIAVAQASPADFFLLFGVAKLYAAAGFRPAQNPLIWLEMQGARTGQVQHAAAEGLMILPLRAQVWPDDAVVDLMGCSF